MASRARKPSAFVKVNGTKLSGLISCEVDMNQRHKADKWHCVFALRAAKAWGIEEWTSENHYRFQIYLGEQNFERLILTGDADSINVDPVSGTVKAMGRDLTASFVENTTKQNLPNWTVGKLLKTLASMHKLNATVRMARPGSTSPEFLTKLNQPIGAFYDRDSDEATDYPTHWDMLCFLAQRVGATVYVKNKRLHFVEQSSLGSSHQWRLEWYPPSPGQSSVRSNVTTLEFGRALPVAGEVVFQVISHNPNVPSAPIIATVRGFHVGAGGRFAAEQARNSSQIPYLQIGPDGQTVSDSLIVPGGYDQAAMSQAAETQVLGQEGQYTQTVVTPASAYADDLSRTPDARKPFKRVFTQEIPGLTLDVALSHAQSMLDKIMRQERTMTFFAPGDEYLDCESAIKVNGIASELDGTYLPDKITHFWSLDRGYLMSVEARKNPVAIQATIPGAYQVWGPVPTEQTIEGLVSPESWWDSAAANVVTGSIGIDTVFGNDGELIS